MSGSAERQTRVRILPALAVTLGLIVIAVVVASAVGSSAPPGRGTAAAAPERSPAGAVPDPVAPAFAPPRPRPLASQRGVAWYSPVRRDTLARAAPDPAAAAVAPLSTRTPEGTRNIVLVLGRAKGVDGALWIRVRLAVLSNSTGWVPRDALGGYAAVHTRLVVDLERLTATLYRDARPIFQAPIGVGRPEWPTPRGRFYIRNKLTRFANPFYGPLAFGTSARSSVLTDWPAGGFVGIHGTNRPDMLPGHVSHGCIRLRNDDVLTLGRLMPVGTPLTVR
jgi:lipoprotein-anchoring transpeptidase ErfK/SrfK